MAEHNMPECFCPEEDCAWEFFVTAGYRNPNKPGHLESLVDWTLKGIPQTLAQLILQANVDAVNDRGFEVYLAWLEQCLGEETPEVQAAKKIAEKAGLMG